VTHPKVQICRNKFHRLCTLVVLKSPSINYTIQAGVVDTGGKWKKSSIRKVFIFSF
jgi:hypothetical protein